MCCKLQISTKNQNFDTFKNVSKFSFFSIMKFSRNYHFVFNFEISIFPNFPGYAILQLWVQSGYRAGGGIRANEIKGFLNIWCNQRRLKPEYEFIERGKPPKAEFSNEPKCCFFAIFGVFLSFGEQVRACKELQNFQRKNRFEN